MEGNSRTASLLVIDNYDSFTFNLVQMFRQYPLDISVVRADKLTVADALGKAPDYVLISPGPKSPASAGISTELVRQVPPTLPLLGVCLGMQCINEAFGGATVRAPLPLHGKQTPVHHAGTGLFAGMPNPCGVARYHSLAVSVESPELEVTARSDDGVVMGIEHRSRAVCGVQFHPESFLTELGHVLIENFLARGPLARDLIVRETGRQEPVASAADTPGTQRSVQQ